MSANNISLLTDAMQMWPSNAITTEFGKRTNIMDGRSHNFESGVYTALPSYCENEKETSLFLSKFLPQNMMKFHTALYALRPKPQKGYFE